MSPRLSTRRFLALLAGAALLAGCGGTGSTPSPSAEEPNSSLDAVSVTGTEGQKPAVKVPTPFSVTATDRKVLAAGNGSKLAPGQRITINYVGVNGTDGKEFDTSYGKADSATFTLDQQQIIKGMVDGLSGTSVGSRVLDRRPAEGRLRHPGRAGRQDRTDRHAPLRRRRGLGRQRAQARPGPGGEAEEGPADGRPGQVRQADDHGAGRSSSRLARRAALDHGQGRQGHQGTDDHRATTPA